MNTTTRSRVVAHPQPEAEAIGRRAAGPGHRVPDRPLSPSCGAGFAGARR